MNKKNVLDFITSVPFILIILSMLTLAFFWFFIHPKHNYIINSMVLSKESFLKVDKTDKVSFLFLANLFPEINKKSSYQTKISELELQKASLRKEIKIFDILKKNPKNNQALFDMSVWFILSSGIRNNLNQVKEDRSSRLLAGLYYLKLLHKVDPQYKAGDALAKEIENYILERAQNNRRFYDNLSHNVSKDLSQKPDERELKQEALLNLSFVENNKTDELALPDNNDNNADALEEITKYKKFQNLSKLCAFYDKNINKSEKHQKLGFILSSYACYSELSEIEPDNRDILALKIVLYKQFKNFDYEF